MQIKMKFDKETKGAIRYQEVDDKGKKIEQGAAMVGTLYTRKAKWNGAWPQDILVTIETA